MGGGSEYITAIDKMHFVGSRCFLADGPLSAFPRRLSSFIHACAANEPRIFPADSRRLIADSPEGPVCGATVNNDLPSLRF
jgi:hypothetical protein